jgi:hypothetical protein
VENLARGVSLDKFARCGQGSFVLMSYSGEEIVDAFQQVAYAVRRVPKFLAVVFACRVGAAGDRAIGSRCVGRQQDSSK